MLRHLHVENYALIENLDMDFDTGLNIITGETGAGKSILLGALGLLLGDKNDSGAMRDASKSCIIEGVFDLDRESFGEWFEENDLDFEEQTTIRRTITASGKSRAFIGDLPVQLSLLRELGERLIDIHSQHRNLLIKDDSFRLGIIDSVAEQLDTVTEYRKSYFLMGTLRRELAEITAQVEASRKQFDYISYQYEQLKNAGLREGELEELEEEYLMLTNADNIRTAIEGSLSSLDEEETGVLARLKNMSNEMERIVEIFPRTGDVVERLKSSLIELRDITDELNNMADGIESNPERLEVVGNRINTLYDLQQKHNVGNIAELIALREEYRLQIEAMEGESESTTRLQGQIDAAQQKCNKLASQITNGRTKAAPIISKTVVAMLQKLGIESAVFEVAVTPSEELRASGADNVEFLFSANRGMTPRGIDKIASGGEISRVMLALKALMARRADLPTIIFDEIDTGVSGRVADAMGEIVAELGGQMQVVNITHLPQVASKGKCHMQVYKEEGHTHIRKLTAEERVTTIAAMLSGSTITEAAIAQAQQLLGGQQ